MNPIVLLALIGVLGGIAVGLQGPIGGAMSQRVGGASSSLVIHLGGAVCSLILLLGRGGEQMRHWRDLSWFMWGAGALGVVLYLTISVTFPRLGAAMAITCIIVGQLLAGVVLDHFGLGGVARPLGLSRALGVGVVLTGAWLIYR
jgi:transporter family-2 protein